jgi:hypothetical protein
VQEPSTPVDTDPELLKDVSPALASTAVVDVPLTEPLLPAELIDPEALAAVSVEADAFTSPALTPASPPTETLSASAIPVLIIRALVKTNSLLIITNLLVAILGIWSELAAACNPAAIGPECQTP